MSKKLPSFVKLVAMSVVALAAVASASASSFRVPIDQARPLRLKDSASGIVIGNPSIAGVSLQSDKLLFVTGRSYGTTNLIVVGADGRPVYQGLISVVAEDAPTTVIVTKGVTTVRNTCSPRCRQTPDVADDNAAFNEINSQAQAHSGSALRGN